MRTDTNAVYQCDFCHNWRKSEPANQTDGGIPYNWTLFEIDEKEQHSCSDCATIMSQVFVRPGLFEEILLQTRLGKLGYDSGWHTSLITDESLPNLCTVCFRVKDETRLARILDFVEIIINKVMGNKEEA